MAGLCFDVLKIRDFPVIGIKIFTREFAKKLFTNKRIFGIIIFVPREHGALAQLVARLNGIQKVRGSTPLCSTTKTGRSERSCRSFFVHGRMLAADMISCIHKKAAESKVFCMKHFFSMLDTKYYLEAET